MGGDGNVRIRTFGGQQNGLRGGNFKKGRRESPSFLGASLQREDLSVWQNDERVPVHDNLSFRDDEKV